jgi:hypothetical protein
MNCRFAPHAMAGVLAAALLLPPLSAAAQTAVTSSEAPEARARFARATRLYRERKFSEALPLFEALARETRSPNALLYVGHCHVKLQRNVAAHRTFASILGNRSAARDDKYDTTREAARNELFALEQKVAKIMVAPAETPQGFGVTLDGIALEPEWFGVAYAVEPGTHRLEARADGRRPEARDVQVAAGETQTVSLALQVVETPAPTPAAPIAVPADDGRGTLRMAGFVALGVGVAGFAVFTVAGLSAKSVHDDLEADCPSGCDDAAHRDDASRGRTLQTTANVGLVVGALGAAGGATLLFLGRPKSNDAGASVALSPGGGLLSYRGRF